MGERQHIELEQGWDYLNSNGVRKLIAFLEADPDEVHFSPEEYMTLYTTVFNMCMQRPPFGYSKQLYARYRECFEEYMNATVLPAVQGKQNENMLRELVRRWENHKIMVKWLSRFFSYLDRYYVSVKSLPSLCDTGNVCFRDVVYQEVKNNVKDAVILLIDKERDGEQIDRALLKDVLGLFVEIGMGRMDAYRNDFEKFMLEDTTHYYQRKASLGIEVDEYLKQEKKRVEHYLHASSESNLLEVVSLELLRLKRDSCCDEPAD